MLASRCLAADRPACLSGTGPTSSRSSCPETQTWAPDLAASMHQILTLLETRGKEQVRWAGLLPGRTGQGGECQASDEQRRNIAMLCPPSMKRWHSSSYAVCCTTCFFTGETGRRPCTTEHPPYFDPSDSPFDWELYMFPRRTHALAVCACFRASSCTTCCLFSSDQGTTGFEWFLFLLGAA